MNMTARHLLIAGLLATAISAPPNVRAGLMAHFKLDEGSMDPATNTVFSAVSGYTGTFSALAPTWGTTALAPIPASEGGTTAYLQFPTDSAGAYVVTDVYGPTGATARTVCAWVKYPSTYQTTATGGQGSIVSYGSTAANTYRFTFTLDGSNNPKGRLRFEIAGANMVGNSMVADGQWHHVAMSCPNDARMSNVVLYVDGNKQTLVASASLGTLLATSQSGTVQPVHIGATIHNFATICGGFIDDIRIYDHQLTDSEVLQLVYGAGTAPGIGQEPLDAEAPLGATNASASFAVGLAAGSPPISYQWKRNGVNLPGATNQILHISPVTAADIAAYSVGVTNPSGGTLSRPAALRWSTPPIRPREETVLVGSNASFSITLPAESTGYTYQWQKGGSDLAAATNSSHILAAATLADAADYRVRVDLAGQTAISPPTALHVLSVPASPYPQAVLAEGVAAYWRLSEVNGATVAVDATGFHPGYFSNFIGTELQVAGALTNDPDTAAQFGVLNHVEIPTAQALQPEPAYSLEAWVLPGDNTGRHSVLCSRSQFLSRGYELASSGTTWQFRTGNQDTSVSEIWNDLNGGTVTVGEWHHLVATYDGTTKRLFVNGQWAGSQTVVAKAAFGYAVRIGAGRTYTTPGDYFSGTIDDVAVYWTALSEDQVARHYSAGRLGPNTPPYVLTDIVSRTNYVGGQATFRVTAQGSDPLRYQWTRHGTNLPGATSPTLTLTRLQLSDAGPYRLSITNNAGATHSATAQLVVLPIPEVGYRGLIMGDGPAAYYPLDDSNASPTAVELLNFGLLNGSYAAGPTQGEPGATPQTGASVLFDGTSQSVLLGHPTALDLSGQVSLEAWVKPATNYSGGGFGNIIAHGYGGSPSRELVLRIAAGQYQYSTFDGVTYGTAVPVPANDIGQWVHLVGTYDGADWRIYRNGALAAATPSPAGALTVGADWALGARGTGTERFFRGGIDEAAIYPYALGGDQVARHYLSATGLSGTLAIALSGTNLVLTWNAGLLEETESLPGAWTALTTAVSPHTNAPTGGQRFYRLRW